MDILKILIHLLAPFISTFKKGGRKDKTKKIKKKTKLTTIKFRRDNMEQEMIVNTASGIKNKCFLIKKFDETLFLSSKYNELL
tara:strand:- start:10452 stop:10700 length:249 start_codon:yes stop_codon:yes gene_type:complete